jgi:hypothetical protein
MYIMATAGFAMEDECAARSGPQIAPVIELYTSEGCSSCPPAEQWLSRLKAGAASRGAVVEAFHVGYWDSIGWVDRFAAPAFTDRQRDAAARNGLRTIYTPQVLLSGRDWPQWGGDADPLRPTGPARVGITLREIGHDRFEAAVTTAAGAPAAWSAYWTVTADGYSTQVGAGENAGRLLRHDFVVRQYTPVGEYRSAPGVAQLLTLRSIASDPDHPRRINLVVFDPRTGRPLQAVSAACS